jgi:hypothetical protein
VDLGGNEPIVEFVSHPIWNRNRPNVASLANQIDNSPVFFAPLEIIQSQGHGFVPPQPAREQQREQGPVAFSFQAPTVGCLPKCMALFWR